MMAIEPRIQRAYPTGTVEALLAPATGPNQVLATVDRAGLPLRRSGPRQGALMPAPPGVAYGASTRATGRVRSAIEHSIGLMYPAYDRKRVSNG